MNGPPMVDDDLVDNGQAESRPFFLACEVGIEDVRQVLRRNPRAIICDFQPRALRGLHGLAVEMLGSGLQGVQGQIVEGSTNLIFVVAQSG